MDELDILKAEHACIDEALADWALSKDCEKEGIWYVSGIVEVAKKLLDQMKVRD